MSAKDRTIRQLADDWACKRISRRDFITKASLLGFSLPIVLTMLAKYPAGAAPERLAQEMASSKIHPAPRLSAAPQILRFGAHQEFPTLDPDADPSTEAGREIFPAMYENLSRYGYKEVPTMQGGTVLTKDANVQINWILESWEISPEKDFCTFKVRDGITFPDGSEVTADDVIYLFERALGVPKVGRFILGTIGAFTVEKAPEKIDDHTCRVYFDPVANSLSGLMFTEMGCYEPLLNSKIMKAAATTDDPWAVEFLKKVENAARLGTAPWVVTSFETTEYKLEARPGYWGGAPGYPNPTAQIETIHGVALPDATSRTMLLRDGALDMTGQLLHKDMKEFADDPNFNVYHALGSEHHYMALNMLVKPFDDVRVRQAINHAVPRQLIADRLTYGFAEPALGAVPTVCRDFVPVYEQYDYNLDKAGALVKEAGYENGFEFTVDYDEGYAIQRQVFEVIASELQKIGVTMRINAMTGAALLEKWDQREATPDRQAGAMNWPPLAWDATYFSIFGYLTPKTARSNWSNWGTEETDDLIARTQAEVDAEKRADLAAEFQQAIGNDAPRVPLLDVHSGWVTRKEIKGVRVMDVWVRFEGIHWEA